jgi:hypothetical protein
MLIIVHGDNWIFVDWLLHVRWWLYVKICVGTGGHRINVGAFSILFIDVWKCTHTCA